MTPGFYVCHTRLKHEDYTENSVSTGYASLGPVLYQPRSFEGTKDMAAEDESRAKRLKLLREAKERKERQQNGEEIKSQEAPVTTTSSSSSSVQEKQEDEQLESTTETSDAVMTSETQGKEDEEEDSDLMHLAPKRANWDIERDIAPMLKKLEKRTQHSIVEILRTYCTGCLLMA